MNKFASIFFCCLTAFNGLVVHAGEFKNCAVSAKDANGQEYSYDTWWESSLTDDERSTIGFKCRTSKGAIFERVSKAGFGEAWRSPDGLIWSEPLLRTRNECEGQDPKEFGYCTHFDYVEGAKRCEQIGAYVPSKAQFEQGEKYGIREGLPWGAGYAADEFWTSTKDSGFYLFQKNFTFVGYYLGSGKFESRHTHDSSPVYTSVRCVDHE